SVLIDDTGLAAEYRRPWDLLQAAGDLTAATLKTSHNQPRQIVIGGAKGQLWFPPTIGQVDLEEARKIIEGARQAILFLMFNPGPADTLLNKIIDTARAGAAGKRLYIHGAINQDPSTTKNPVKLFDESNWERADYQVVLPAAIDEATKFFRRELRKLPKAFAMVHSKIVLVDPFGAHP